MGEYWAAKIPNHPNANSYGFVLEHRVIYENKIGKILDKNIDVHHINGNKLLLLLS